METDMDFGPGKAINLERIVLSNQKKIERLLRMGSNDSEIERLKAEIAELERRVREADEAMRQGEHLLEAVVSKAKENRLEAEMQQSNMQEKLSEAERQSRVAREDLAQFQKNAEAERQSRMAREDLAQLQENATDDDSDSVQSLP